MTPTAIIKDYYNFYMSKRSETKSPEHQINDVLKEKISPFASSSTLSFCVAKSSMITP